MWQTGGWGNEDSDVALDSLCRSHTVTLPRVYLRIGEMGGLLAVAQNEAVVWVFAPVQVWMIEPTERVGRYVEVALNEAFVAELCMSVRSIVLNGAIVGLGLLAPVQVRRVGQTLLACCPPQDRQVWV